MAAIFEDCVELDTELNWTETEDFSRVLAKRIWRERKKKKKKALTVFLRYPARDDALDFVQLDILHPVRLPVAEDFEDFLAAFRLGCVECEHALCRLQVENPREPVLANNRRGRSHATGSYFLLLRLFCRGRLSGYFEFGCYSKCPVDE